MNATTTQYFWPSVKLDGLDCRIDRQGGTVAVLPDGTVWQQVQNYWTCLKGGEQNRTEL